MTMGYYTIDWLILDRRIVTPELHTKAECLDYAKKHGIKYSEWE